MSILLAGLLTLPATAAHADELGAPPAFTTQAVAANAQFLADRVREPPAPAAICSIDSGIDPEVAASDFLPGQVRLEDLNPGGTGADSSDTRHGTLMARVMGAVANGQGMVGIFPGVRIVSVRALKDGEQEFRYQAYLHGINRCLQLARDGEPIRVISLSLGGETAPSEDARIRLAGVVRQAREAGMSVVAAAGNQAGPVLSPAREDGVVGVAAGQALNGDGRTRGQLCAFSAGQPPFSDAGLDVVAPGCFLDQIGFSGGGYRAMPAAGSGSSQATALVSGLLAAGAAYRPELHARELEAALIGSSGVGGPVDARTFFTAIGVDHTSLGTSSPDPERAGASQQPPPSVPSRVAPPSEARFVRFARPQVTAVRRAGRRLILVVARRPAGAAIHVRIYGRRSAGSPVQVLARRAFARTSRATVTLPRGATKLDVRFRDPGGDVLDSRPLTVPVRLDRRRG